MRVKNKDKENVWQRSRHGEKGVDKLGQNDDRNSNENGGARTRGATMTKQQVVNRGT